MKNRTAFLYWFVMALLFARNALYWLWSPAFSWEPGFRPHWNLWAGLWTGLYLVAVKNLHRAYYGK